MESLWLRIEEYGMMRKRHTTFCAEPFMRNGTAIDGLFQ